MIYTPANTDTAAKVYCADTGVELRLVTEIDTVELTLDCVEYPIVLTKDGGASYSTFKYSSIEIECNQYGHPVKFNLSGMVKT